MQWHEQLQIWRLLLIGNDLAIIYFCLRSNTEAVAWSLNKASCIFLLMRFLATFEVEYVGQNMGFQNWFQGTNLNA